jgi:hypothetical protein
MKHPVIWKADSGSASQTPTIYITRMFIIIKLVVFCFTTPCILSEGYQIFKETPDLIFLPEEGDNRLFRTLMSVY